MGPRKIEMAVKLVFIGPRKIENEFLWSNNWTVLTRYYSINRYFSVHYNERIFAVLPFENVRGKSVCDKFFFERFRHFGNLLFREVGNKTFCVRVCGVDEIFNLVLRDTVRRKFQNELNILVRVGFGGCFFNPLCNLF